MSAAGYADFLRCMGHNVRESGGVYWFDVYPRVYISFPSHRLVDPSTLDPKEVLGKDGWFLRYSTAEALGRPSYRLTCDLKEYDLNHLSPKARNQTRRGLEQCHVRALSFEELQESGLRLDEETLARQGRKVSPEALDYRKRYYQCASQAPGAEAWGAFVGEDLAAYLIAFRMEGCANILIVRSSSRYLKFYPNNALFFKYVQFVLGQPDISEVSTGLESLQKELGSLDHFKEGMAFRKVSLGQRIEAAPWLSFFLTKPVVVGLKALLSLRPSDERFNKISGMLDWYEKQPKLKG